MDPKDTLVVFEGAKIRRMWHDELWYFSVVDIVGALTNSSIPRRYWSDLKIKLNEEGFELYNEIVQLKLWSCPKLRDLMCFCHSSSPLLILIPSNTLKIHLWSHSITIIMESHDFWGTTEIIIIGW